MSILCLHHSQKENVSNKCFSHLRYQHRRQNAVPQLCLLAPTLRGTRKLKPGHMEFSPVSGGKTRQHKQTFRTNTKNPSWPENCLCCGEGISAGKTRQHKQKFRTNTKNPSWPENCLCCGEDHGITIPPPHDFRQQHNQ